MSKRNQLVALMGALGTATIIAACGGGGGGGGTLPPPNPSPSPSLLPSPAASPQLSGSLQVASGGNVSPGPFTYSPAGGATVVFSCGCSTQAGTSTADGSGNFTLVVNSTPTPSVPNPTYTIVPGRNYLIVGSVSGVGEAWNLEFAGAIPAHNLALSTPSDVYSAAAALYVYANSPSGVTAFDEWNFNAVAAWLTQLHNAPNAQEMKLLNDIAAQSAAHNTLFPAAPSWNPAQPVNATIAGDLVAVKSSADAIKPTPCPSGACTGTPSP